MIFPVNKRLEFHVFDDMVLLHSIMYLYKLCRCTLICEKLDFDISIKILLQLTRKAIGKPKHILIIERRHILKPKILHLTCRFIFALKLALIECLSTHIDVLEILKDTFGLCF